MFTVPKISLFQFHKGTIKTLVAVFIDEEDLYFNSIKVQLRPIFFIFAYVSPTTFQFHKGTIKTKVSLQVCLTLFNFNSIKVQLRHLAAISPT